MSRIRLQLLSQQEINTIHNATLIVLRDTGIKTHHEGALNLLADAGAQVDRNNKMARLNEPLVMDCISRAGKQYALHGRSKDSVARFGCGDTILMSSPGQFSWIDLETGQRRPSTVQDLHDAIRLGDALHNIKIVGAMAAPSEAPVACRDVFQAAELVKGTHKPTRCWITNGRSARHVLEIYRTVAGGDAALRQRPMVEAFLEPISPLQLPRDGLDIMFELVRAGQPVSVGPMAMTSGTAPATLAGTLVQENAEILAGVVIAQLAAPGIPITYGGIPHIMDPRTSICSFGSPEQSLMAVAMTEIARSYGFPVYVNVGLTDAKALDAQAGIEKGISLMLGMLAGADTFGHAGICGADHAASLSWLFVDNELMDYAKRIASGFEITPDTLAAEVIQNVGPAGNYLAEDHTMRHFRKEMWVSGKAWTRQAWDTWVNQGGTSIGQRASAEVKRILGSVEAKPIDESLDAELDRIVEAAQRELV